MKSLLLLFLLFLHTLCENVTTPNSEEDTDMTATPSTITPLLSTAQNPSLPKTSKLPLALKTPVPTFPFSSLATSDWLSSMPTIQTLLPPPLPLTTLEVPENENFGFTSLAPLWTLPTQPPAWSPMLDSPIKPIQNSMFPTFPTMPTLPTLPTLAPFTFPTLPPPTTMKPLNITIDPEALMDVVSCKV